MFVHTTYLQLSWSLKALPASPHCSSRDLVCPVIPLNVELPHKHHLLPIVTIWVPCWRCYCGMLFSGHEMDIIILYQSSRDYLQGILMGADLLPLLYRESGRRVTGPSPEITATPFSYTPLCELTMWSYLGLQKIALTKCTWFLVLLWEGKLTEVDI